MNSLSVKAKFLIHVGQFKSLKQTFCKFEGQFDLEGQGHKLLKLCKALRWSIHSLRLKVKFLRFKLLNLQGITQNLFLTFKANFIIKVKVTSFQTRLRHLDT